MSMLDNAKQAIYGTITGLDRGFAETYKSINKHVYEAYEAMIRKAQGYDNTVTLKESDKPTMKR